MNTAPNRYHCASSQALEDMLNNLRTMAFPALTKTAVEWVSRDMPQSVSRLALSVALLVPSLAGAQATPLVRGDRFFDTNVSVSFYTDRGPHFALLRNRKVVMLGFKNERVFSVGKHFVWEYLLGAEVAVDAQRSLEVAWKFQHWSNANMSHFNPGLDANLVTVGLKRRR